MTSRLRGIVQGGEGRLDRRIGRARLSFQDPYVARADLHILYRNIHERERAGLKL